MKKTALLLLLLVSAVSGNRLFGQSINMPLDSVKTLLCKKWVMDYSIVDNQKLKAIPGTELMNFEFVKDGTVLITFTHSSEKNLKGTWVYDAGKKQIKMTINKNNKMVISGLKKSELITYTDMKDATPGDPTPIIVVYKEADSQ